LADWVARGRTRPLAVALDVGIQLCWGLAHCHGKGLVHRDLKPLNVLMTRDGQARLTDFGTVKFAAIDLGGEEGGAGELLDRRRPLGAQLRGTRPSMPPARWARDGALDPRADLYALGVTLFEMLTGAYPVRPATATVAGWAEAHARAEPPRLRSLRPDAPEA